MSLRHRWKDVSSLSRHWLGASLLVGGLLAAAPGFAGVPQANLGITKTNSVGSPTPGGLSIYTIVASNAGPNAAPNSQVVDNFPAPCVEVSWTCFGSAGGTCTAGPVAGNIADTVNLPVGGSVTYTAICHVSPTATGMLANTATVATSGGVIDPTPANNSATDTDTLAPPNVNLSMTKTDGLTTVMAGQPITYTIVASNSGPSAAVNSTLTDILPVGLTGATWTCVPGIGSGCSPNGSGNIVDTVIVWPNSSVTYTVNATVSPQFFGDQLLNQVTITQSAGGPIGAQASDLTSVTPLGPPPPPPTAIPALSPLGFGLLALGMSAAAFFVLRRGSRTTT